MGLLSEGRAPWCRRNVRRCGAEAGSFAPAGRAAGNARSGALHADCAARGAGDCPGRAVGSKNKARARTTPVARARVKLAKRGGREVTGTV